MPDTFLEASGLHSYYGQSHVLHGVDLRLAEGEIVALMGRNGMGKTTLLKTLLGLVKPAQGRILLRGDDVTTWPSYLIARAGLAYVPEGRGIFPNLTVRENLVMAARAGRSGRAQWDLTGVLDLFPRLGQRLNKGGGLLSGGEQQMLAIGRALMTNPDLLILDEATEGLAPLAAADIWKTLDLLRRTGLAAIIVDKDLKALCDLANRVVILVKGSVVFEGPSGELRARPEIQGRYLGL